MNSVEEIKQKIIELLRTVYDPEIPINIYDLGLVYEVNVAGETIEVVLGLTTPFCPIAHIVVYQVESILKENFKDRNIVVRLDLERMWSPEKMSEEGRKLFKLLYGYDILDKK
ncbi:MAG: metal-sulfur cluster assembly factor [Ignisphaera sp.]